MYLFYANDIPESVAIGQTVTLDDEQSAHAVRVLRHAAGDTIHIADGRGNLYEAIITNPHPKHCEAQVRQITPQAKHHRADVHIAVAPTKNIERVEWLVEKCTEIGADEITMLLCRFSERKQIRMDRLEKIMLSAAKQSLKHYLPVLHDMQDFKTFIREQAQKDQDCFIAHCYKDDKRELKSEIRPGRDVLVLIGPEGDFSEEEVNEALALGFKPVGLGKARLRTETAAIVACHTAVLMNEY